MFVRNEESGELYKRLKRNSPNLSNYKAISILKFTSSVSIQMFDQTGWRVLTSDTRFTCGSCKRKLERGRAFRKGDALYAKNTFGSS